ncbi:MAG: hypothetical protein NTX97_06685 [Bacteroidetes bacterium]|nr:hypothetical protein [Bacteroidota bacterium]
MEDQFAGQYDNMETPKRSVFLTVLCILTFISSGIAVFVSLIVPPIAESLVEVIQQQPGFDAEKQAALITILNAGWTYHLSAAVCSAISLAGAIMMWKLLKNGFHFYTLSNILLTLLPTLIIGSPFNILELIFPSIFIFSYALNLRFMK